MHVLPFSDVEEAKSAAHDLRESLHYFSLRHSGDGDGQPIGLQQTYGLMAAALGCQGWVDLKRRLLAPHQVVYYATDRWHPQLPAHDALAKRLVNLLHVDGHSSEAAEDRLRRALFRCAFGCGPLVRKEASELRIGKGYTWEQMAECEQVSRWYSYHARYNSGRTAFDIRMLEYERERAYARIFGTRPPIKPRRRTSDGA
jgi:hypothetical protein